MRRGLPEAELPRQLSQAGAWDKEERGRQSLPEAELPQQLSQAGAWDGEAGGEAAQRGREAGGCDGKSSWNGEMLTELKI